MAVLHIVVLLIVANEGKGHQHPPDGGDAKADDLADQGREDHEALGQAAAQNVGHHGHQEGDAGADVAPGVAVGGDRVHAVLAGHVVEHGIVEGEGGLIEDLGQHVDDQKRHPAPGEAVEHAADDAGGHRGLEEYLLGILPIRQGAEDGPQQRHDHRDHGDGDGIIGRGLIARDLARVGADGQLLEPDGDQRAGQHGIRGVAHVVQHPGEFLGRKIAERLGFVQPVK